MTCELAYFSSCVFGRNSLLWCSFPCVVAIPAECASMLSGFVHGRDFISSRFSSGNFIPSPSTETAVTFGLLPCSLDSESQGDRTHQRSTGSDGLGALFSLERDFYRNALETQGTGHERNSFIRFDVSLCSIWCHYFQFGVGFGSTSIGDTLVKSSSP